MIINRILRYIAQNQSIAELYKDNRRTKDNTLVINVSSITHIEQAKTLLSVELGDDDDSLSAFV